MYVFLFSSLAPSLSQEFENLDEQFQGIFRELFDDLQFISLTQPIKMKLKNF